MIIVCVKQVPVIQPGGDSGNHREVEQLCNNPNDLNALEAALCLKERYGGQVTCLSMGPPKCGEQLKELLAMGADEAVLLSSAQFAGSDTYATSCILAAGIRKLWGSGTELDPRIIVTGRQSCPDLKIILTGEQSVDGETGQVGPGIAELLGIPHLIGVESILEFQDSLLVEKSDEEHKLVVKLPAPALVAVRKSCNTLRIPTIRGRIAADRASVTVWSEADLQLGTLYVGTSGSPTQVIRTVRSEKNHNSIRTIKFYDGANLSEVTEVMSHVLEQ